MQDLLADSITALFADHATPASVRRAEEHGLDRDLWNLVCESGFDKALLSEGAGGSGLAMRDVVLVFAACGRYAAPIPLGETMLAHAFAESAGATLPDGVGTAGTARAKGDRIVASAVPWGESADWVMAVLPRGSAHVFDSKAGRCAGHPGMDPNGECEMEWRASDARLTFAPSKAADWEIAGAALRAAQIAGALDSVLELTSRYASARIQFGRPLTKFQAIQQQIAILAEDVFAARMAAAIACDSESGLPHHVRVGSAKAVASEAAARAFNLSHAIHGAMGITEEYDLQLFTRRLLAWRMQYGSESYWAAKVGGELLGDTRSTWDFVRGP